jgi:hypothetical protein
LADGQPPASFNQNRIEQGENTVFILFLPLATLPETLLGKTASLSYYLYRLL